MKKIKAPNTVILVLCLLVAMAGLTWIIPGGEYERVEIEGREVVDPESFEYVESDPVSLTDLILAPVGGFNDPVAVRIIVFILIVSGSFSIVQRTGAFDKLIHRLARFFTRHPEYKLWLIPAFMFLFALMGSTFGMSEEIIVFIPLFIPLAIALGFDSITGIAIPFVGARIGFAGAFMNPFTVGISQELAEIPLFSGWELRLLLWFTLTVIGCGMVMMYARSILKDPKRSPVYELDRNREEVLSPETEIEPIYKRDGFIIALFGAAIVLLIYGVSQWEWFINELTGLFLTLGVVSAFVGRITVDEAVEAFLKGMRNVMLAVVIVSLSRSILLLMQDARVIDTILHYLSSSVDGVPAIISTQLMLGVQTVINIIVPSGSGQAALTIPILAPLGDLVGIPRQTVVLIFQLGDGLSNLIIPTAGVTMAVLGMARIPWEVWAKWMIWRLLLLYLVAMVFIAIAVIIGYS